MAENTMPETGRRIGESATATAHRITQQAERWNAGRRAQTWVPHLAFAATEMAIVAMSDDRSTR